MVALAIAFIFGVGVVWNGWMMGQVWNAFKIAKQQDEIRMMEMAFKEKIPSGWIFSGGNDIS